MLTPEQVADFTERMRGASGNVFELVNIVRAIEQAAIQQQALEYVSLFDQCSAHLARIAELEADRDSWRDQASQRVADWDEMRKERDALKADVERWREFAEHQTWCADCGESVSTCPIGSRLQKAALQAEKEPRS